MEVTQLVAEIFRSGDDGVMKLLKGGPAALHGSFASRAQDAQRFNLTISVLGHLNPLA